MPERRSSGIPKANQIHDDRAALLSALNEAIGAEDRDLQIGPSYFMRAGLESDGALERVFAYDLLPLLEEHYYGRLTRDQVRERFGLEALRTRLGPASEDGTEQDAGEG